jgi:hypothetical protein
MRWMTGDPSQSVTQPDLRIKTVFSTRAGKGQERAIIDPSPLPPPSASLLGQSPFCAERIGDRGIGVTLAQGA